MGVCFGTTDTVASFSRVRIKIKKKKNLETKEKNYKNLMIKYLEM